MYKIHFYKDSKGREPVYDYIKELSLRKDKDSRIKINKIKDYLAFLQTSGLHLKEPYIKHLSGDLWELRPIRDRILFAAWDGDGFILLHNFVKKTQKTPLREIEIARTRLEDYKRRKHDKK